MTSIKKGFHDLTPYDRKERIIAANDQHLSIAGIGSINLPTPQNQSLYLSSIYFVPKLSTNLILVDQLVDHGFLVIFSSSGCVI